VWLFAPTNISTFWIGAKDAHQDVKIAISLKITVLTVNRVYFCLRTLAIKNVLTVITKMSSHAVNVQIIALAVKALRVIPAKNPTNYI
jgi:hypothetical protein